MEWGIRNRNAGGMWNDKKKASGIKTPSPVLEVLVAYLIYTTKPECRVGTSHLLTPYKKKTVISCDLEAIGMGIRRAVI